MAYGKMCPMQSSLVLRRVTRYRRISLQRKMKKINENDIVFETEKLKSPLGILQGYTSK